MKKAIYSLFLLFTFCFGAANAQSNHTVTFSNSASDFNAAEIYTAQGNQNTDYYITFDASNLYIGAFRVNSNTFGSSDNLAIYIDTDPNSSPTSGTGTTSGQSYNNVSGTLPFTANYDVHVEQSYQEARSFGSSWASTISGVTYSTNSTTREVKIPLSSIGNPNSIYITMWMGYNGGHFANVPGANDGSGSNQTVTNYFGGIGLSSAYCIPKNITNTPITDILTNGNPVSGATYGKVSITSSAYTAGGNFSIASGGSLVMSGGSLTLGANTLSMGAGSTITNNGATFTTTNSTLSCAGDVTLSGSSSIALNTISLTTAKTVYVATDVTSPQNYTMGNGATNTFSFTGNKTFTAAGITSTGSNTLVIKNGGSSGSSKFITSSALTIATGTSLSLGASDLPLQVNSNVTLSGTGSLTLGSAVGGDIYLTGDWTYGGGSLTPNGRAVTFNGTGTQTISSSSPPNTFDYMAVSNVGGSVKLSNAVTLANNLQLFTGTLDLNQQTLTLSNTSNIELGDGTAGSTTESITSTVGTGTISVPTTKTITVAKRSGVGTPTFTFGSNALVNVVGTFDPGSGLTTFASGSTLRLSGGSVSNNSPAYNSGSSLIYNGGAGITLGNEWPSSGPTNVTLNTTSTFLLLNSSRSIAGDFTMNTGTSLKGNNTTLTLSGGSSGTPTTFTANGTMYGEFGGNTLGLTFSGYTNLSSSTGYLDAKAYTISGTLVCGNVGLNTNSASPTNGSVTVSAGGTLKTTNTSGLRDGSTNNTTIRHSSGNMNAPTINSTSTIEYNNASGGQTISALTYGNLTNSNTSGTNTLAGTLTVNGTLTLSSSSTMADGGFTLTAGGNLAGTGTHTSSGSGKISMTGSGSTISGASLGNLTLNNAGGFSLSGSPTINGALTLTAGNLDVNGKTLTLAGTVSATSALAASGTGSTVVFTGPSTIPSGLFTSNTVKNLTISRSGGVTMGGDATVTGVYAATSGKLAIANNTLTLNGSVSGMSAGNSFTASHTNSSTGSVLNITSTGAVGTVYFDQTTDAATSIVTTGTNGLRNLTMSGSGGTVTLGNKVNVFNKLSVTAGTLTTGGLLVLRSHAGNTAYVEANTTGVSGLVTVERYVHASRRAWRLMTAPLTQNGTSCSATIQSNWQSAFGYSSGYGTNIYGPPYIATGAPNGYDGWTNGNSVLTYDPNSGSTGGYVGITSTTGENMFSTATSAANKAYLVFVRGDKTVTATSSSSTPNAFAGTTLAAKGNLQTGTQTFNINNYNGKYVMVPNPFAAPVDVQAVMAGSTGLDGNVYTWDPNLGSPGVNAAVGGYCTFNSGSSWLASSGSQTKYIQSGQGFFVMPSSSTASVVFTEANKSTSTNNNTQTTGAGNGLNDLFRVKLNFIKAEDGSKYLADGMIASFGAAFSKDVAFEDGPKLKNGSENISFKRNGSLFAIEGHPFINGADTLFVNFSGLKADSAYELQVEPSNFDATVTSCKLVDHYLATETPMSLNSTTVYPFTVTASAAASSAANRFEFIFNGSGPLPNNGIAVKAAQKEKTVVVNWEATAENGVRNYNVEKSTNGKDFAKLNTQTAKNGSSNNAYNYTDMEPVQGSNYYRIKATDMNDNIRYSQTVKVDIGSKLNAGIAIYPNPSKGNNINVQLTNVEKGICTAVVVDMNGKQVASTNFNHEGGSAARNLGLNTTIATGTYTIKLSDSKGNSYQTKLVVE